MTSGYTSAVAEGEVTDFATFVMRCARAFGPLAHMRDEPPEAEIPEEFGIPDYMKESLREAEERFATHCHQDFSAARKLYDAEMESAEATVEEVKAKSLEGVNRCARMREHALAWKPPTAGHEGLKAYMIEQLDSAIDDLRGYVGKFERVPFEAWQEYQAHVAEMQLERMRLTINQAMERAAFQTNWVRELRESLKPEPKK